MQSQAAALAAAETHGMPTPTVILRKCAAVGATSGPGQLFGLAGAVAFLQSPDGVPYLRLVAQSHWIDCDLAVLLGQLATIHLCKEQIVELDQALDEGVTIQRLAHIVDLPSLVSTVEGWKKQQPLDRDGIGRDIEQVTCGRSPRGVELRLDQHTRPLPDGPANHLLSAFARDLLRDGNEAVALFCHRQRLAWYVDGIAPAWLDEAAKTQHVGLDELGWAHDANLPHGQQESFFKSVDLSRAIASTAYEGSPYCYLRDADDALPIGLTVVDPSINPHYGFKLEANGHESRLSLHEANLLIARLTAARDAYQAALEAQREDEAARHASLAEPDDAAPGHELIEPQTFTATVVQGAMLTVDGCIRLADAIFHQTADGKTQLDAVQLGGHAIAEGDQVRLQRMDPNTVRVIERLAASGAPAIDFTALYQRATTPPDDLDERDRFFNDERDAAERFDEARIDAGAPISLFPLAQH